MLRTSSLNISAGDIVHFDENGEFIAGFELTNWVTSPNNSFVRVKVGKLNLWASSDKELMVYDDRIVWHRSFSQVRSMCLLLAP